MCIHRKFSHESVGERIFKIGPHLPKLLSNIKGYTVFLGHSVENVQSLVCTNVSLAQHYVSDMYNIVCQFAIFTSKNTRIVDVDIN